MDKYDILREQYPDFISLEQFHKICKIAKRTAKYLVDNGIVPAIDTKKKTRRYKISINDVIIYLRLRDQGQCMMPRGVVTSGSRKFSNRKSYSIMIVTGQEYMVTEYFRFICNDCADILTTADIQQITGLGKTTIQNMFKAGHLKSISDSQKHLIPKEYFLEFVGTQSFIFAKCDSEAFKKVLDGFLEWKTNQ